MVRHNHPILPFKMKLFVLFALVVATASAATLNTGEKSAYTSERISYGHEAKPGEAPYIVSLKDVEVNRHDCGGSIIHPNWVLTAAHCLNRNSIEVVAGLHSRNNETNVQIRQVDRRHFIMHEKYGGGAAPYDIGLIYILEAFNLNEFNRVAPVGKVSLPTGQYPETGRGKTFGWGLDNTGHLPNVLQSLDVNIIGYAECKALLPFISPIDPVNICTYTAGTASSPCTADSGDPLVRYNENGVEQVGIVSWGYPCNTLNYPSAYTKVSSFKKWITTMMKNFVAV